jgi:hypothetical protein
MGVLTKPDINILQQMILSSVVLRKREQENQIEEARFEQNMFVNNPEMYKVYLKHKEDNEENEVYWSAPTSIEEKQAVEQIFAQVHTSVADQEKAANEEFIRQMNLNNPFANIDIDKMGDE